MFGFLRGKSKDKSPGRFNDEDADARRGRASSRGPVGFGSDDLANGTMPREASHLAPPSNVGGGEASPGIMVEPIGEVNEGPGSERREKSEKKEKKHRKRDKDSGDAQQWATGEFGATFEPGGQWGGDWSMNGRADMGPGGSPPEQQSSSDPAPKTHRRHKSRNRNGAGDMISPPSPGPSRRSAHEIEAENTPGMTASEAMNYQAANGHQQYPGMQGALPQGLDGAYPGMPGQMQQSMDGQYPMRDQGTAVMETSPVPSQQQYQQQGMPNRESAPAPPWQAQQQQWQAQESESWQANLQQQQQQAQQQPWQVQPTVYPPQLPTEPYRENAYSYERQGIGDFYSQPGSLPMTPPNQEQYYGGNSPVFPDSRSLPATDTGFNSNPKRRDSYSWLGKPYRPVHQDTSGQTGPEHMQGVGVTASIPNIHTGSAENPQVNENFTRDDRRSNANGIGFTTMGSGAFNSRGAFSAPTKSAPKLDLEWAKPTAIAWNTEGGRRKGPDLGWAQTGSRSPALPQSRKTAFEDPVIWTGLPSSHVVRLGSEYQGEEDQKQRSEELIGILQEEVKTMKHHRDNQQEAVTKQLRSAADAAIHQLQSEARHSIMKLQGEVRYQEQRQAALVEQMHSEMREQEKQKDALLEKLQVEMRQKEQQKEALLFHLQDELRQKEQQKELEVQQLQGEIKLKEHEKDTIVQQLQGEIQRLREQQHDSLVLHLQEEVNRLKSQTPPVAPDTSPWDDVGVSVEGLGADDITRLPSFGPVGTSSMTFSGDLSARGQRRSLIRIPEDSVWKMNTDEIEQYRDVFVGLDINNVGMVGASEARALFDSSGLPANELSVIWRASDIDGDSHLSETEFICAMAIVKRRKDGVDLPTDAPNDLLIQIAEWKRGGTISPSDPIALPSDPIAAGFSPPTARPPSPSPVDSPWAASQEEIASYQEIFMQHEINGIADPAQARSVLEQSGLPVPTLSRIWFLADVDGDGNLTMVEFVYAMAVVARHLQGAPLPEGNDLPPELIASVSAAGLRGFWSPTPEELERFRIVFESLGCVEVGGGSVGPNEGGELLDRSQLPQQERAKIWQFADADCDGRLAPGEFICAMTLVARRLQGAELPDKLPGELRNYTGVQKDLVPTLSPMPMPLGMPPSPSSASSAMGSPMLEIRTTEVASSSSTSSPWAVTTEELERWRSIFAEYDNGSGLIGAFEAKKVLEDSGLPTADLSRIWELSDVKDPPGELSVGEFICAMALVRARRRRVSLPSVLPPELEKYVDIGGSGGLATSSAAVSEEVWRVTPEDLQRFQAFFKERDVSGSGFLNQEEVQPVLASSHLPSDDLDHIWSLADHDSDGKLSQCEFIWAMQLVLGRRQGAPLPQVLPQTLIASVPKR